MRSRIAWVLERPHRLLAVMVADILVCGWIFSILEHHGPIEGPWWAIVTGSTTGYGDLYPQTTAGRGVAAFLMCTMVIMLASFTAQMAARLIPDPHLFSDQEQRRLFATLDAITEANRALISQNTELAATVTTLAERLDARS